jgi:MYXO-CTERM domain-containing protein
VHEVGHWLALDHVHEGGCMSDDLIDDTPAQLPPPSSSHLDRCAPDYVPPEPHGCEERDSCPDQEGVDSKSNWMGYWNLCRSSFTPQQVARMTRAWEKYRAPGSKGDDGGVGEEPAAGCRVSTSGDAGLLGVAFALLALATGRRRRR